MVLVLAQALRARAKGEGEEEEGSGDSEQVSISQWNVIIVLFLTYYVILRVTLCVRSPYM